MAYIWQPVGTGPGALGDLARLEFTGLQQNLATEAGNIARDEAAHQNWLAAVRNMKANTLNQLNAWRQEQQRRIESAGITGLQAKLKDLEWQRYSDVAVKQAKATEEVREKSALENYKAKVDTAGETFAKSYGFAMDDFNSSKAVADEAQRRIEELKTELTALTSEKKQDQPKIGEVKEQLKKAEKGLVQALTDFQRKQTALTKVSRSAALDKFEIIPGEGIVRHPATGKSWSFGGKTRTVTGWIRPHEITSAQALKPNYPTKESVKDAFSRGELNRERAIELLTRHF